MRKPALILKFIYLIILGSCTTNTLPETKYDTSTLNVKGNIKHITERKTNSDPKLIDIEFKENSVFSVTTENSSTPYLFEYEEKKLNNIKHGWDKIKPADFPLAFELSQSPFTYNCDSLIKNNHQDPIKAIFKDKNTNEATTYRIEYTYDQFNNWIIREVFYGNNEVVLERAERTILYTRDVQQEEITTWNEQADSIFRQCKIRKDLGKLIDTTIDKNKQRLKQIDAYVSKYYKDVMPTDTTVKTMLDRFNKTYGQEQLSPELQKVQKKLNTLHRLALTERSLYTEVSLFVPLLASGKKSVKDTLEPYSNRYTLTYTFELLSNIQRLEVDYFAE
jgi:hypothetical protein